MARLDQRFQHFTVTFPTTEIVQVTIDRPEKLNCINKETSREIARIWDLLDGDEHLRVGIITGKGRAFCTGADLEEWNAMNKAGVVNDMAAPGLAGLPRRHGKKPIIAAINGITMGGGFEMVANCDIVLASISATFALPEVKRGLLPVAGCLPRLAQTLGVHRTTDLVLSGRTLTAQELFAWGLISRVVGSEEGVVNAAIELAQTICHNSPDAVILGRVGIRMAWQEADVEQSVTKFEREGYARLMAGENFAEGIRAFAEKRVPRWSNSKL